MTHSGSSRTSPRSRHWTSHRSTSRFAARSSFEMGFSGDLLILISVCLTIDGFCYENAENFAVFPDVAKKDHRQRLITSGLLRELSRFRLKLPCCPSFCHLSRKLRLLLSLLPLRFGLFLPSGRGLRAWCPDWCLLPKVNYFEKHLGANLHETDSRLNH